MPASRSGVELVLTGGVNMYFSVLYIVLVLVTKGTCNFMLNVQDTLCTDELGGKSRHKLNYGLKDVMQL